MEPPPVICDAVIEDILSRLPMKPLIQFRCLSKSWASLLSDPCFVKFHMQTSPDNDNANLLLTYNPEEDDVYHLVSCSKHSFLQNPSSLITNTQSFEFREPLWPLGSYNGLVCFSNFELDTYGGQRYWFIFYNPAMRLASKESPHLHFPSSPWFGFGYDSSSYTHKVAALNLGSQETRVIVHTMGNPCWREILKFPTFPLLKQRRGQFVNGNINWLGVACEESCSDYEWRTLTVNQLVILSLDLEKETYKKLLLPAGFTDLPHVEPQLAVLSGFLSLFYCHNESHLVIWQMKEFGVEKSWTKFVDVSYQHLQIEFDDYCYPPLPCCTYENGDVVVLKYDNDSDVILYNREDHSVEHIGFPDNKLWIDVKDYVQSLFSPC